MKRTGPGNRTEQTNGSGRTTRSSQLPEQWRRYQRQKSSSRIWIYAFAAFALGACGSALLIFMPIERERTVAASEAFASVQGVPASVSPSASSTAPKSARFSFCHTGGGINCVVDGDTIWMDGVKIRVADIDAPETHPSRCAREAELGDRATQRLLQLVNEGAFEAVPAGSRDEDKYGRKLRVLVRDGRSLGDILVQQGLARTWDGSRHPWC